MTYDLSGLRLCFSGLTDEHAERLAEGWSAFASDAADAELELSVRYGDRPVPTHFLPKAMRYERTAAGAHYAMEQGSLEIDLEGRGSIELVGPEGGEAWFALMNFVRAAIAWSAPRRPAGLVHAAAAVVDERAWLLVGHEGAGKSTWARTAEEGGARVVSDDLVLVDREDEGWVLCDAPFHSTHRVEHRPGRWPIAGVLFPVHGRPALESVPAILARARWLANLPFVDAALDEPHLAALAGAIESIEVHQLRFDPDPSWLKLLA